MRGLTGAGAILALHPCIRNGVLSSEILDDVRYNRRIVSITFFRFGRKFTIVKVMMVMVVVMIRRMMVGFYLEGVHLEI